MGDEGIVLSDQERQALAGLAEQIGDPWLARQLVGQETPPPNPNASPNPKHGFPGAILQRLTAPAIDPALREEIRQLVVARNHRRLRAGKPPLDVESEIEREITSLGL